MRIRPVTPALWSYRPAIDAVPATPLGYDPGPPGRTFVLAPFAGGSAYSLTDWLPVLVRPGDRGLLLQYPGRGPRVDDPMPPTLAHLADEATGLLLRHSVDPLVLVGHSMGAVLVHEMAQRLQDAGREVALLVASASRPPHRIGVDAAAVARITPDEWAAQMVADGFVAADRMPPDMLADAVAALRSDCLLVARHVATDHALTCPVLALGGEADDGVTPAMLRQWADTTTGVTDLVLFPGGHFYYRDQLPGVAAAIEHALSRVTTR